MVERDQAVTDALSAEAGPLPRALWAYTEQRYAFPALSVVTVIGLAVPDFVRVVPPLLELQVTTKDVMALPLLAPAVNDTLIWPDATRTAVTPVGALGAPTTIAEVAFTADDPTAFTAVTWKV